MIIFGMNISFRHVLKKILFYSVFVCFLKITSFSAQNFPVQKHDTLYIIEDSIATLEKVFDLSFSNLKIRKSYVDFLVKDYEQLRKWDMESLENFKKKKKEIPEKILDSSFASVATMKELQRQIFDKMGTKEEQIVGIREGYFFPNALLYNKQNKEFKKIEVVYFDLGHININVNYGELFKLYNELDIAYNMYMGYRIFRKNNPIKNQNRYGYIEKSVQDLQKGNYDVVTLKDIASIQEDENKIEFSYDPDKLYRFFHQYSSIFLAVKMNSRKENYYFVEVVYSFLP